MENVNRGCFFFVYCRVGPFTFSSAFAGLFFFLVFWGVASFLYQLFLASLSGCRNRDGAEPLRSAHQRLPHNFRYGTHVAHAKQLPPSVGGSRYTPTHKIRTVRPAAAARGSGRVVLQHAVNGAGGSVQRHDPAEHEAYCWQPKEGFGADGARKRAGVVAPVSITVAIAVDIGMAAGCAAQLDKHTLKRARPNKRVGDTYQKAAPPHAIPAAIYGSVRFCTTSPLCASSPMRL